MNISPSSRNAQSASKDILQTGSSDIICWQCMYPGLTKCTHVRTVGTNLPPKDFSKAICTKNVEILICMFVNFVKKNFRPKRPFRIINGKLMELKSLSSVHYVMRDLGIVMDCTGIRLSLILVSINIFFWQCEEYDLI